MQTAQGAGTPYATLLRGIGAQLEQAGQTVSYADLAPTTADDPTGLAIGTLGLPLLVGGMATSAALVLGYRGRRWHRLVAVTALAATGGVVATAILQLGFGALDGDFWLTSAAVAAGILAIAFPVLGLESRIGTPALGLMGVTLLFVANPLSGLATGPQWLPAPWGDVGQLLPIGAAGTAVRSAAYFDGAGSAHAWLVLGCWAAAGLLVSLVPRRSRPAHAS